MSTVLRVGLIGAGLVAQTIHLPTLSLMNHLFTVVIICDVSRKAVEHCQNKFYIPKGTTVADEVLSSSEVDVVFVLTSDEYHTEYTTKALANGKHVFLEKPLTLSMKSGLDIVNAEKTAGGPRVFVGTMRRYAPSFTQAFAQEVASIPKIVYARSRGIIGHNNLFVPQGGWFSVQFKDVPAQASADAEKKLEGLLRETLGPEGMTKTRIDFLRYLASLGSHDLSLMREALGFPESVCGVTTNHPFYTATLNYKDKSGNPFTCVYETGIDMVPRFDSHLAVYGEKKTVMIQYDTPFVKGLPIKVKVDELVNGEAVSREILSSFEDAYTVELQELHACLMQGKEIKTSAQDSIQDLQLWQMMLENLETGKLILSTTWKRKIACIA